MAKRLLRRFVDLPFGQVHLRRGGQGGVPLLMLHSAAASSCMLEGLGTALAAGRAVVLPDLPGCGASDALPAGEVEVGDLAAAIGEVVDALGLREVDAYGLHLGARIAIELALARPALVRRLIIDGNGFYDPPLDADMIANVAPEIRPDLDGLYLMRAWSYVRDYFLFFPWYRRDAAHRRDTGLPAPEAVHEKLLEILANGTTYPIPYRAAFRYPIRDKLPQLRLPTLVTAGRTDNVFAELEPTAALVPGCARAATPGMLTPDAAAETARIFAAFLDG